jgi:hypothetical protein
MSYWIWVKVKSSGNERWAKDSNDETPQTGISLEDAIALCAKWNMKANLHEYTVRKFGGERRKVDVTVQIEVD